MTAYSMALFSSRTLPGQSYSDSRRSASKLSSLTGLPLAVGEPANVVVLDPSARWVVDPAQSASRSRNTPFAGRTLRGRAVRTIVDGRTVWELEAR